MGKEKTNLIKRVDIKEVHALNERTKELQCVYRVFKLFRDADIPHERILQQALENEKAKLFRDVQRKYEKILSGFIPICASCKKIKDEQGIWHPLEIYVQSRTEATFSHGICPDCVKKLYPHFQRR
jgi:hypothetical protein